MCVLQVVGHEKDLREAIIKISNYLKKDYNFFYYRLQYVRGTCTFTSEPLKKIMRCFYYLEALIWFSP
jgi:hypothetical protein